MNTRRFSTLTASVLALCLCPPALAQATQAAFVRLADIEIDATQLESFKAAAREHAEAVLRTEPEVLALHAVAEKDSPSRIRVLEMYADANAYRAHLKTPHFQKFRTATDGMVRARKLFDTVSVVLGAKPQLLPGPLVRIAELEIDPAQIDAYKAAVTEEIEASIRVEPGVLAIYSVALKDNPTHLRFFEIYADEKAYRQHLESPHFRKYVDVTKAMIRARKLLETEPIALAVKPPSAALPPAYYVSEFEVTDPEGIKPYSAAVDSTFALFGGRYVVRGGKVVSLEGEPSKRVVMIEFPSMEQALAWYNSPTYRDLRPIRHKSATSRVFILEGTAKPAGR